MILPAGAPKAGLSAHPARSTTDQICRQTCCERRVGSGGEAPGARQSRGMPASMVKTAPAAGISANVAGKFRSGTGDVTCAAIVAALPEQRHASAGLGFSCGEPLQPWQSGHFLATTRCTFGAPPIDEPHPRPTSQQGQRPSKAKPMISWPVIKYRVAGRNLICPVSEGDSSHRSLSIDSRRDGNRGKSDPRSKATCGPFIAAKQAQNQPVPRRRLVFATPPACSVCLAQRTLGTRSQASSSRRW